MRSVCNHIKKCFYIATPPIKAFEVVSKLWLAAWTSNANLKDTVSHQEQENNFIVFYGSLGLCQAMAFLAAVMQVNN